MNDDLATSVSMLKAISESSASCRWNEFVRKYDAPMRSFLRSRYPSVDADEAVQETLIALTKALPDYRYTPDTKGHFHNYLMGILAHKATDLLRKSKTRARLAAGFRDDPTNARPPADEDRRKQAWRITLMEVAIEQLMADPRILPATREIFRHVALLHEKPEDVAALFKITRNNVDQIKRRMIDRLSKLVDSLSAS